MTLSNIAYKIRLLRKEIEFLLITGCLLFFPAKTSYSYFLVSSLVISFFLLKEIIFVKNIGFSRFSTTILVIVLIFSASILFSVYKLKSFLLVTDIFLVCFYFFIFYYDREEGSRYFHLILFTLTLFSFLSILDRLFSIFRVENFFFENSILQGIASGLGALMALFFLLKSFKFRFLLFLVINTGAVYVSSSKAAFLGLLIFGLMMLVLNKKRLIPVVLILIVLTAIIPNPVKNAFEVSLRHDPYFLNRIDIWKLTWRMFKDHFLFGVGPDNFSELSKKYNFRQEKGPANYFKIPRSPHSDYLKIVVETGLPGLIGLIFLLLLVVKKLFSPPLFHLSKILLLYILFQALLFNFVFQFFFLFLVIFLGKDLFEKKITFTTLNPGVKWFFAGAVGIIFIFSYLFPFLADTSLGRARSSRDYAQAFDRIERARFLNPLNHGAYYSKALLYLDYFEKNSDMGPFYYGIKNLKRAQSLNENHLPAYLLEFEFYRRVLKKNLKYPDLLEESLAPLRKAEEIAPFNPFVVLIKAQLYLEFNRRSQAKAEALRALKIEPGYVSAHYFLQDNYGYYGDADVFKKMISAILSRAKTYPHEPGSYLDSLFKIPR